MYSHYYFEIGPITAKVKAQSPEVAVQLLKLALADGRNIAGIVEGVQEVRVQTVDITKDHICMTMPYAAEPDSPALFDFDEFSGVSGDITRLVG